LPLTSESWAPLNSTRPARTPLTPAERAALYDHAAQAAATATAHIRAHAATSPAAAADAAQAASDTLHVAASLLASRPLRQAADFYDRAAREPHGRIPAPTPAGNQLRHAARLMANCARLSGDHASTAAILILQLAALAEALAELRQAQQRAAQAAVARAAAQRLHIVRPAPARPPAPPGARTAADLSAQAFPRPPVPHRSSRAAPGQRVADQAARPARRPTQPRPRGPTR
jgi:hypothetical protein